MLVDELDEFADDLVGGLAGAGAAAGLRGAGGGGGLGRVGVEEDLLGAVPHLAVDAQGLVQHRPVGSRRLHRLQDPLLQIQDLERQPYLHTRHDTTRHDTTHT